MDKVVPIREEHKDTTILILQKEGEPLEFKCLHFGMMDGFLDFIGFWKGGEDHPFYMLDAKNILSLQIMGDEVDNSETD